MGRTKQTPRKKKSNSKQNQKKQYIKKQQEQLLGKEEQPQEQKTIQTNTTNQTKTKTTNQTKTKTTNTPKKQKRKSQEKQPVEHVDDDVVMKDVQSFMEEKKLEREKILKETSLFDDPRFEKVSVDDVNGKRPSSRKRRSALREANRELVEEIQAPVLDKELGVPVHDLLDVGQVYRAAEALLDFDKKRNEELVEKKVLFQDPDFLHMIVTLNKIPAKNRRAPHLIDLPNPLLVGDVDICIFVKDPSKEQKQLIKDMMIPNVKKIIGIKSLREKYRRFEARRKLADSYDVFLCDENISMVLPKLLGKVFFKDKKFPAPIKINSYLPERIERAVSSTQLHITQGPCLNVHIGNTEMSSKEIAENIIMSIDQIASRLPNGKWNNIKSLALKLPKSPSLPFYTGPQ